MSSWLTLAETRETLHTSTEYVLSLIADGKLTAYARPGGKFALIAADEVDDVIRSWPKAYTDGVHRGGDGGRYYPGKGGEE